MRTKEKDKFYDVFLCRGNNFSWRPLYIILFFIYPLNREKPLVNVGLG